LETIPPESEILISYANVNSASIYKKYQGGKDGCSGLSMDPETSCLRIIKWKFFT